MATKSARIEFRCDKETLKFTYPLPASLFGTTNLNPSTLITALKPILEQHSAACLAACNPICIICSSTATQTILTPMSWLHITSGPFVHVVAAPACTKPSCDAKIRQNMQELMAAISGASPSNDTFETKEIGPCLVCKKVDNTFRCARCKVAFYCGKEHQKLDWRLHKLLCQKSTKGN